MSEPFTTYLGDSVYAEIENGMVKLTTNNGYPDDPRNIIFLEGEVVHSFLKWLEKIKSMNPRPAAAE